MGRHENISQYINVSSSTALTTTASILRGLCVFSKTTGSPKVAIYDAIATGTGNFVIGGGISGTGTSAATIVSGIAVRTGIYLSWIAGTTASDSVTVFFSIEP